MAGFSNDGVGIILSGGLTLGANRLTLNVTGTSLYGAGLTLLGVPAISTAWAAAVVANGGSVSAGRLIIINTFIAAEQASGAWYLTDDYIGLWGENAPQALTSLKQRRLASAVNSPVFTADRGYVFNGTSNYINTNFTPSTNALEMSPNSIHFEVYERTNVNANTYAGGVATTTNRAIGIRPRVTGNTFMQAGTNSATIALPAATSLGLTQTGRVGAATTDIYGAKNGADMVKTVQPTGVGATLPSNPITLAAVNSAGTPGTFRAASLGYAAMGSALSASQRLARYNAVQAWATSVGAQV